MNNTKIDEAVNTLIAKYNQKILTTDDFYRSSVFYYLSGSYPELSIKECCEVVNEVRKYIRRPDTY